MEQVIEAPGGSQVVDPPLDTGADDASGLGDDVTSGSAGGKAVSLPVAETDKPKEQLFAMLLAEFIGTFALIFAGCGAMVSNDVTGAVFHPGVALAWGLVVMICIYTFGNVSGAHFNTAVTIAFWVAGRFPAKRLLPYIATQSVAAIAAALALFLLWPVGAESDLGSTVPYESINFLQLFFIELMLTFLLMLVILSVSSGAAEKGLIAAIAIGGTVGMMSMFAGPMTRASMNPTRSLGPAVVSMDPLAMQSLWVYIVATVLGASLAVPVHHMMCCKGLSDEKC